VQPCGEGSDGGSESGDTECQMRFNDSSFVCINNVCRPASQCTSDEQCPLNAFCAMSPASGALGNCEPACMSNADCPIGQLCQTDPTSGRLGCQDGCQTNTDCPLTAICVAGQCATTNSMGDSFCQTKQVCNFSQQCTNNVCTNEPLNCSSNANGCQNGTSNEVVGFYTCDSCPDGASAQCPPPAGSSLPALTCASNICLCYFQTCLTPCDTTDDCPKGFNCESLPDGNFCSPVTDGECCLPSVAASCQP
jgi:hypothetical protein